MTDNQIKEVGANIIRRLEEEYDYDENGISKKAFMAIAGAAVLQWFNHATVNDLFPQPNK